MSVRDEIEACLRASFEISDIAVVDDSASHAGHAGAPAAGESHFNVMLRSPDFAGQSRIARHRAVHNALGPIVPRIHALALDLGE
ncbi:MAG: BolA/IbaG family iron-sulfur metabolism protein [Pseudomonadota bacterium]